MNGVNLAVVLGHLGGDPVVRYTTDGKAVTNFSVATTEKWRDKQSNEMQEETSWHSITVFGKQAEACGEYLKKGAGVHVTGKMRTDKYEKDGQTHYSTKVIARDVQFLPRGDGQRPNSAPSTDQPPVDDYSDNVPF